MATRSKAAASPAANNDIDRRAEPSDEPQDLGLEVLTRPHIAGHTTIADTVITAIAGIAAREIPGVYKLGHGRLSDAIERLRGAHEPAVGVHAEVGRREVALDLELVVNYGVDIHATAVAVRQLIGDRIREMTHLTVIEVNIMVVDIHFETVEQPEPQPRVA